MVRNLNGIKFQINFRIQLNQLRRLFIHQGAIYIGKNPLSINANIERNVKNDNNEKQKYLLSSRAIRTGDQHSIESFCRR